MVTDNLGERAWRTTPEIFQKCKCISICFAGRRIDLASALWTQISPKLNRVQMLMVSQGTCGSNTEGDDGGIPKVSYPCRAAKFGDNMC